jgi:hypothetical protein
MGWTSKYNGRKYYYQTIRSTDGTFIRLYKGNGEEARRIAEEVENRRSSRKARLALQEQLDQAENPVSNFAHACQKAYVEYKTVLGYYLHKREWRKWGARHMPSRDEIQKLLDRERARRQFESGDEDALIKKYFADPPHVALECLLKSMPTNEYNKEAYRHQFACLKRKLLAGRDPSAIEGLMASRVALDWIDVYWADAWFYLSTNDSDIKAVDLLDRRRSRAARRLTRSIKCLADLQKTTEESVSRRMPRFEFEACMN